MTTITPSTIESSGYFTLGCCFPGSTRIYTYLSQNLYPVGTPVIVEVAEGFKVAVVNKLNTPTPNPDKIQYKWIVDRVHTNEYNTVKHIRLIPD